MKSGQNRSPRRSANTVAAKIVRKDDALARDAINVGRLVDLRTVGTDGVAGVII